MYDISFKNLPSFSVDFWGLPQIDNLFRFIEQDSK